MGDYGLKALPRQVWGYYHPFYGTPDGPTGRWLTWNEPLWLSTGYGFEAFDVPPKVRQRLGHDPEGFVAPGRRCSYSAFYPVLSLYDCLDRKVLEQHACWAQEASLDGLVWDYMLVGEDNPDRDRPLAETMYDRSFRVMLEVIEDTSIPLQLSPWYDSFCWYGFPVEKIADHLTYLVRTYRGNPHVLHFDGRLVIHVYSALAKHSASDWRRIRSLLGDSGVDREAFLVAGEMPYWKPDLDAPGLFDGFSQYNYDMSDWSADGVARFSTILRELASRNRAAFWSATVGPGFDGRIWHHPGRSVARGLGRLYESMWEAAIGSEPQMITVCSFNEWGEGTQIEPCLEYEDLYLKLTSKWANAFRRGQKA